VDVSPGNNNYQGDGPDLNNCGTIHLNIQNPGDTFEDDVYRYDNGTLTQLTFTLHDDRFPKANDHGNVVWMRNFDGFYGGTVIHYFGTREYAIEAGQSPSLNERSHIVWSAPDPQPCVISANVSNIHYYDGMGASRVFEDRRSNQMAELNGLDELCWTAYVFPCAGGELDWTSDIVLYRDRAILALPSDADPRQIQAPHINGLTEVAWTVGGGVGARIERWRNGLTAYWTDGAGAAVNNTGEVAYSVKEVGAPWRLGLLYETRLYALSNELDVPDFSN
jgi:hypothetical protein